MIPPMIVNTLQPPCVTAASANNVTAPSQNDTAIRITVTEIDAGRSESTMKPRNSHRMPLMRNSHQLLAYAFATAGSSTSNDIAIAIPSLVSTLARAVERSLESRRL